MAGRWFGGCLTTRFKNTGNSIFHPVVGLRELRFPQQACRAAEKLSPPSPISPQLLKTPAQHLSRTLPVFAGDCSSGWLAIRCCHDLTSVERRRRRSRYLYVCILYSSCLSSTIRRRAVEFSLGIFRPLR